MTGSEVRARATLTCSRAVPLAMPHFHDSHAAHDGMSQSAQPLRASNSASNCRKPAGRRGQVARQLANLQFQLLERLEWLLLLGFPGHRRVAALMISAVRSASLARSGRFG